ncbi:MAG: rRNA pseudouridine synthase [Anaerolineae bacterium]|nr:rRNA pseudouridine synthase [Anaerolineae bacterium]
MEERLQKILARAGKGSRRACEELINAGKVTVNGAMAELGMKADAVNDEIRVDGQLIPFIQPDIYIAAYKPRFVLSDREPLYEHRKTIHDLVPNSENLFTVGRLDYESEGLILLTNDGKLKQQLTHPSFGHEKEYRVLVAIRPDEDQMEKFQRGIVLEDGFKTGPAKVWVENFHGKGAWIRVVLTEGHKRQIRETLKLLGLPVVRLVRVRIASLTLGRLQAKEWRYLMDDEVARLKGEGSSPSRKSYTRGHGKRYPQRKPVNQHPSRTGETRHSHERETTNRKPPHKGPRRTTHRS